MSALNDTAQSPPVQEIYASLAIRRLDALDETTAELLRARNFVVVSTIAKSGAIHATPMWVDTDGEHVLLNSEADRAWVRNLAQHPRVTCTVLNHEVPYEFVEIRGHAVAPIGADGIDHADYLATKYLDLEQYPHHDPDNPRILIKVLPERIIHMSPPLQGALPDALAAASSAHNAADGQG